MKKRITGFLLALLVLSTGSNYTAFADINTVEQSLKEKVTEARNEGVLVTESAPNIEQVHHSELAQRQQELEISYNSEIQKLNNTINQQKLFNQKYNEKQEIELNKLGEGEWTSAQLGNLIENSYDNVVVVNKTLTNFHLDPGTLNINSDGIPTLMRVGDQWTYDNVFEDPKTGNAVGIRFTVLSIVDSATRESLPQMEVSTFSNDTIKWVYGDNDLSLRAEFVNSSSKNREPLKIKAILAIIDIDQGQTAKVEGISGASILAGSHLTVDNDGKVLSLDDDVSEDAFKTNWALFYLGSGSDEGVDSFTYTFTDGTETPTGVLQGIGSSVLNFSNVQKEYASANVKYTNLVPYYTVNYNVIPDAVYGSPNDTTTPADTTKYADGQSIPIQSVITTSQTKSNDNALEGKWTFSGWYNDGTLTGNVLTDKIINNDDVQLYGQWKFIPNTGTVTTHYVDEAGNKIAEDVLVSGNVGEAYQTSQKTIAGYTFKMIKDGSASEKGNITAEGQAVTYVYTKNSVSSTKPSIPSTGNQQPSGYSTSSELPKTGDTSSNLDIIVGSSILVGSALLALIGLKKRKENNN